MEQPRNEHPLVTELRDEIDREHAYTRDIGEPTDEVVRRIDAALRAADELDRAVGVYNLAAPMTDRRDIGWSDLSIARSAYQATRGQ